MTNQMESALSCSEDVNCLGAVRVNFNQTRGAKSHKKKVLIGMRTTLSDFCCLALGAPSLPLNMGDHLFKSNEDKGKSYEGTKNHFF